MKGNFPKAILALLIAVVIFIVLRARDVQDASKPKGPMGTASQAKVSPPAPVPATTAPPRERAKQANKSRVDRGPASFRSPSELFTELFRRGEWSISRGEDGRPTGIRGTPIPGATTDARSALTFARKVAEKLGANPEQLSESHAQSETDKGLQTIYKYEQWIDVYPVFGASLTVLSRRQDSAAYLVNSSLRPIDRVPAAGVDRAEAQALVLAYYKDRGGSVTTPAITTPYVYADAAPTELAWIFMVNVTTPAGTKLQVVFGATSRRVLYEAPAVMN